MSWLLARPRLFAELVILVIAVLATAYGVHACTETKHRRDADAKAVSELGPMFVPPTIAPTPPAETLPGKTVVSLHVEGTFKPKSDGFSWGKWNLTDTAPLSAELGEISTTGSTLDYASGTATPDEVDSCDYGAIQPGDLACTVDCYVQKVGTAHAGMIKWEAKLRLPNGRILTRGPETGEGTIFGSDLEDLAPRRLYGLELGGYLNPTGADGLYVKASVYPKSWAHSGKWGESRVGVSGTYTQTLAGERGPIMVGVSILSGVGKRTGG